MQQLLHDLPMPAGLNNLVAYITPPDPNVEAQDPTAYIWPSSGRESRSPEVGGSLPRNSGPGTGSGTKGVMHMMDVYLVYFMPNDDPDADTSFPGMVDAVMYALRFSQPNPAYINDPYTTITSCIYNVGEQMSYRIAVEATEDEVFNRYDALITVDVWEELNA